MDEEYRIRLSWPEVLYAASVGIRRHVGALMENKRDSYGFSDEDGWGIHIEGACGECAVAKSLSVYWDAPVGTFKSGGDVGRIQVRTRSKHEYDLIVRASDRDEDVFVLVTGRVPIFVLRGWKIGSDCKRDKWLRDYGGRPKAYFVPQSELNPIGDLIRNAHDIAGNNQKSLFQSTA